MWTTVAEQAPAGSMHYAVNWHPIEVSRADSPWITRGAWGAINTGSAAGTAVVAQGQLVKADGTKVLWILSSSSGLWTVSGGGYTNVVTAANFATAGVSLVAATTYWVQFNNTIVFNPSDGSQVPYQWDGTSGSASLTELTNAPTAYGRPTVYAAKLFLIKYAARSTIVWSEEADATTGYESGGFSNVWALVQTNSDPIVALLGTNEALYYFRERSIGAIRGQVAADFVTTATHDAISSTVGIAGPAAVCEANGDIWFADTLGLPTILPQGGAPRRVVEQFDVASRTLAEPFGFDLVKWAHTTAAQNTTIEVVSVPSTQLMPYETVWFNVTASQPTAGRAFLIYAVSTGLPVGWNVPYVGAALKPYLSVTTISGYPQPTLVDAAAGKMFLLGSTPSNDTDGSGAASSTSYRLIGAPLAGTEVVELSFDRLDLMVGVSYDTTASLQCLTSRQANVTDASSAMSLSLVADADDDVPIARKTSVGLKQRGRWLRPVLSVTVADGLTHQVIWDGWAVTAYPISTSPTVP